MSIRTTQVPAISVIMPARDAARTIDSAIESVAGQSLSQWELLVIDDASRDDTTARVEAWASRDPRISLLCGAGKGPGAARNLGLDAARGAFVHFLDADDSISCDALSALLDAAKLTDGGAFGAYERLSPEGRSLDWVCRESLSEVGIDELLERNRFPVHAQLISRAAIGQQRFDETLDAVEDWDFWLKLALRGARWRRIDSIVGAYRQGLMTRSGRHRTVARATTAVILRAFDLARPQRGPGAPEISDERRRRVLWMHVMEIATQAALREASVALDIMRDIHRGHGPSVIQGTDAAQMAYWLTPTARGRGPQDWQASEAFDEYAQAALNLWYGMEVHGVVAPGFTESGIEELALLLAPREAIVQDVCAQCAGAEVVTLLGYGANGRVLADALQSRGIVVIIRDDALLPQALEAPQGPLIVTPLSDRAILGRLPRGSAPIRWREAQERLADQWRRRLRDALPAQIRTTRGAA